MLDDDPPQQPPAEPEPGLRREFWLLVGLFNVALLGLGLGALLLYFRGSTTLGWAVLAVGLATGAYGYGRYRRGEQRRGSTDARQD